jgi:hypothetical protein
MLTGHQAKRMWVALACTAAFAAGAARAERATVLQYEEQEAGTERYATRMLFTQRYLRIDDGEGADSDDYLLFDRDTGTIYNVTAREKSILVIARAPAPARAPLALEHQVVEQSDRAPDVGGKAVRHYRLLTNGRTCYDLYAADGLLPQVMALWREYREALGAEQARTLAWTPALLQTPCALANSVYAPARHLAHGLPVRYADADGRVGELTDYRSDVTVDAKLFELPAGYTRIAIDALRGRGAPR